MVYMQVTVVTATLKTIQIATNISNWTDQTVPRCYVLQPNTLYHAKNACYGDSGYLQEHDRNEKDLLGSADCHTADEVG